MRRQNISEELKIGDIVLDDGSEKKSEMEKVANELNKEAQKDLDDKLKDAEEIRDAEAPKAEANDGKGKSLKIKQFVEKLILEEPSDVLNEDIGDVDRYNHLRNETARKITGLLEDYVSYLLGEEDFTEEDLRDEVESVLEQAMFYVEDLHLL